jgi:iron-sulfur cluster insertion protein
MICVTTPQTLKFISSVISIGLKASFSGFKYNFSFDKKIEKDDIFFNKTVIDSNSLKIINGSTVDYQKEMIGSSFVIKNPQAASSCGCGMSFSV